MTKEEHLVLAKKIWDTRSKHLPGTTFAFLNDFTPEEFAEYYDALRGVVTVEEVVNFLKEQ